MMRRPSHRLTRYVGQSVGGRLALSRSQTIDAPHIDARPQQLVCYSTAGPVSYTQRFQRSSARRRYQRSSRRPSPPHSSRGTTGTAPCRHTASHPQTLRLPDGLAVSWEPPELSHSSQRRRPGASEAALRHGDADAFSNRSGPQFCLQPLHRLAQLSGKLQPGLLK